MTRWDAEDYARNSSQQAKWARELMDRLPWRGDEWVLDVGAGDGKVTAELAGRVPKGKVVGIDKSDQMVGFAQERFGAVGNLEFRQMDAQQIEMSERFDVVFSNATLHWVRDHRAFLRGAAGVMKMGAKLLISCGGRGNARCVQDVLEEVITREAWRTFFQQSDQQTYWFLDHTEYRPWLAEAGLEARRVELTPKDMVHAGPEGLAGWLRTTWMPHTHRVPEAQREEFVQEVVAEYVRRHPLDAEGNVHVGMVRLEVEAVKVA